MAVRLFPQKQRPLSVGRANLGAPNQLFKGYTPGEEIFGVYAPTDMPAGGDRWDVHTGLIRPQPLGNMRGIGNKILCVSAVQEPLRAGVTVVVTANLESGPTSPTAIDGAEPDPGVSCFAAYDIVVCPPDMALSGLVDAHRQRVAGMNATPMPISAVDLTEVYADLLQQATPLG